MQILCVFRYPVVTVVYVIMQESQKQMNYGWSSDISLPYVYNMCVTNKSS